MALNSLKMYFKELETKPNESSNYYYTARVREILSDKTYQPIWPILYTSTRFEDNILQLLHGIHTEIKEIPHTTTPSGPAPPAPIIDVAPVVAAMNERFEDLKRETSSSLKSFADAVKVSAPTHPSPPPPPSPPKPKNSPTSIKGNPLPKAVIRFRGHVTPHARASFVDLTSKLNRALHDHPKFSHVRVVGVKWTIASNLLVCAQAPSPSALVAALEAVQETLNDDYTIDDIIPNARWSRMTLSHVYTGKDEADSRAYLPEEIHEELTTQNPIYAALTIRQLPSWIRDPKTYRVGQLSSISFAFEDPDGTRTRQLLGSSLTAFGNLRCTIKAWVPPKKPPQKN